MFYFYVLIINIILLVNSSLLQFETSCDSSQFIDLENLIGSLHRYVPDKGHLIVRDMGLTIGQQKLLKIYQNIEIISSTYKRKENIPIINVKNEFFFINNTLINHYNNGKYNYIDLIRKKFYLAIVIPFIQNQFNNLIYQLNFEKIYSPCRNQFNSIDLIFYHNENRLSKLENQIRQINYQNNCFKNIRIFAANLSKQENRYPIGSAIMWKKLFINEQFSDISLRYHGYTHFFLMEPDARPIRSYWLDAIVEQIIKGRDRESYIATQWWMIGSIYRGFESIGQYFLHINGNALYHLSLNFIQFLEYISYETRFDSKESFGYDLDIFLYLLKHIDKGKQFWHKFQFSDFIQNCWHTGCNETNIEFLYNNPNTYLIHGNKIQQKLLDNSFKKSNIIIILIICILFLLGVVKRIKYFCWKSLYRRNFLLRIIFK
ncbi:unnamed protein product [Rotaria sordida]|uniref:Uncharacterized protein n=2 Tax=Rotaria sordida TaxID=392033 RepID=A0A815RI21_9BILA|nr:unnamed protein product [Rotaria sordida]CAF1419706.1 unnamed protein product [Rotaria sordida]CAF1475379.1 unnamed protein product [Rotaria sordida]CAF3755166.1 unnamed protein product [Rotaria sordida]CAF3916389.1 unnamed protein product [Rotaria sordida]